MIRLVAAARAAGFALLAMTAACAQPDSTAQFDSANESVSRGGNPLLPMEALTVETQHGPVQFRVEMATTDAEREAGLMFRREMDPDHGMLFDFNPPQQVSFWMHNTFIPLDIIFIGPDGRILNIAANARPLSDENIPADGLTRAVLELNGGRAAELGIARGDLVRQRIFSER